MRKKIVAVGSVSHPKITAVQLALGISPRLIPGGTAEAGCKLVEMAGSTVAGLAMLIELTFLKGRDKTPGRNIVSLLKY